MFFFSFSLIRERERFQKISLKMIRDERRGLSLFFFFFLNENDERGIR